jgi:transposase
MVILQDIKAHYVLGDKGYDSNKIVEYISTDLKAEAVIPSRSNRKEDRYYDKDLYKDRNQVERLFCKLKQYRRIATRYDRNPKNYLGFIYLASIKIMLQ